MGRRAKYLTSAERIAAQRRQQAASARTPSAKAKRRAYDVQRRTHLAQPPVTAPVLVALPLAVIFRASHPTSHLLGPLEPMASSDQLNNTDRMQDTYTGDNTCTSHGGHGEQGRVDDVLHIINEIRLSAARQQGVERYTSGGAGDILNKLHRTLITALEEYNTLFETIANASDEESDTIQMSELTLDWLAREAAALHEEMEIRLQSTEAYHAAYTQEKLLWQRF